MGSEERVPADCAREAWLMNFRGSRPEVTKEQPTSAEEVWALLAAGKAIAVLPGFLVAGAEGQGVRAVPLADVEPVDVTLVRRADDTRATVLGLFTAAAESAEGAASKA